MAPSKPALDLNAMVNGDRQRRKNELLAQELFGSKNRRSSAPGAGLNKHKSGAAPTLASRITGNGITKRSVSTSAKPARAKPAAGNVDAEWTHDLHSLNNPSAASAPQVPRGPRGPRARNERIQAALNGSVSSPSVNSQFNIVGVAKPTSGFSIRGLAGPYTVMAKNLALGTTAADIESAMTPVGGVVLSCRIIAERPKVIAELIFETKEGADNVVETFNNQNADGNILHVFHKAGPSSATAKLLSAQSAPITPAARAIIPLAPRADTITDRSENTRSGYDSGDRYPRGRSRERRRDYDRDEVMDGSYGFDDRMDTDDRESGEGRGRGLYSDNLIGNRGRGRGNSRDRGGRGGGDRGRGYR